ncbi:MAG: DUF362 domain-containing protein [Chitinivibrionales bacterium]|nr:DUF362 domain-containing protein [Chitinivibrionales bacterium]
MKSSVYFLPCQAGKIVKDKLVILLKKTGWIGSMAPGALVAIKLHFGEQEKPGPIHPAYVAQFTKDIKSRNGKPFLVETSTLYAGRRSTAYDHLLLAYEHGYTYEAVRAPIIMADGLRGQARTKVAITGQHFKEVEVASDVRVYDSLLTLSHVTGHVLCGLGAAIKNLGMGLASRAGKRAQHSALKPTVIKDKCIACNRCNEWCPANAIGVRHRGEKALIDPALCIGCGECLTVCPSGAVAFDWNADQVKFQEKMAEYALGMVTGREEGIMHVNFITAVTRDCDCMGKGSTTYFDDIGVVASRDPVAVDQAAADLVNKKYGKDFFREMYPEIDYTIQLRHGEKIGLGSREYELEEV